MPISDLADAANLYDNWVQLKSMQIQLQNVIDYHQTQINQVIANIQANPQFPSVDPTEQKYLTDLPVATATAMQTIDAVKSPEVIKSVDPNPVGVPSSDPISILP